MDVYTAQALLREKTAHCRSMMIKAGCSYLVVPTVMHHYLVSELQAQEDTGCVQYNAHLGKFTNFVNLLGLAAISVPAVMLPSVPGQVCLNSFFAHIWVCYSDMQPSLTYWLQSTDKRVHSSRVVQVTIQMTLLLQFKFKIL